MSIAIYQTNGKTIYNPQEIETSFFVIEHLDIEFQPSRYEYNGDSLFYELDNLCVTLYDVFQNRIFPSQEEYYKNIDLQPQAISKAGLDSDFNMSKDAFQALINTPLPMLFESYGFSQEVLDIYSDIESKKYRYAYLADCHALINTTQELIHACNSYFISFYKLLCNHPSKLDFEEEYFAITTEGRLIFSTISALFTSMYSIFDIITKIALELEHLKECSNSYPKLYSSKLLYGDKKDIKNIDFSGSIFEPCKNISLVVNLRNELVHNAAWEMNPKIFFSIREHQLYEKCIYLPDFNEEGHLITFKGRKRFFSQGNKLNELLPDIYFDIFKRIANTLSKLC